MSRTRIISANKAIYASATGLLPSSYNSAYTNVQSGLFPTQLHRIDSFSFDVDLAGARQDIREFGRLSRLGVNRTNEVTANLSIGYYLTNGENEHTLGLNIFGLADNGDPSSQFISGVLTENPLYRERNIYVLTVGEGIDAFSQSTFDEPASYIHHDVLAFGNAGLTNYTVSLSVGDTPRADVEMEAANFVYWTGTHSGLPNPSINRMVGGPVDTGLFILGSPNTGNTSALVLGKGDINISFSNNGSDIGGADLSEICIQSVDISVPLSRTPIECLTEAFPVSRPLDTPIDASLSINALIKDFTPGSLEYILTGSIQGSSRNATVNLLHPDTRVSQMKFVLQNLILDSQSMSQDLDGNETVDLTFSTQLGGANSTSAGIFVTGQYSSTLSLGNVLSPSFQPKTIEYSF